MRNCLIGYTGDQIAHSLSLSHPHTRNKSSPSCLFRLVFLAHDSINCLVSFKFEDISKSMSRHTSDEEASLSLAQRLEAYDKLAFLDSSQSESPLQTGYPPAARRGASINNRRSVASSSERNNDNEEHAIQFQSGANSTHTPPMSDEEFARLLQMQEDQNYFSSSNSLPQPFTPPHDYHGKLPLPVASADDRFRGPLSPPKSPTHRQSPSSGYFPPYPPQSNDFMPESPSLVRPPSPPRWIEPTNNIHSMRNDPAIHGTHLTQPFLPPVRTHSPTVFPSKITLMFRIMMKFWRNYYKRNGVVL